MANENEVKTISISIDEYFDLRTKAEMNMWLSNEIGTLREMCFDLKNRVYDLEQKMVGENNG